MLVLVQCSSRAELAANEANGDDRQMRGSLRNDEALGLVWFA